MAQQAALRVHCDRRARPVFACHPQSHLLAYENDAYRRLHGLDAVPLGERLRLYTLDDLKGVRERLGAVLMELPERSLGGALRPWDEVEAMVAWAREQGIAMHLDGARLRETQAFYGKTPAEIAQPFDTVYVSFYKALGGIAGAALTGPKEVIDEARGWQWRHGGRLVSQFPYIVSARDALQRRLPLVPQFVERARAIAERGSSCRVGKARWRSVMTKCGSCLRGCWSHAALDSWLTGLSAVEREEPERRVLPAHPVST